MQYHFWGKIAEYFFQVDISYICTDITGYELIHLSQCFPKSTMVCTYALHVFKTFDILLKSDNKKRFSNEIEKALIALLSQL